MLDGCGGSTTGPSSQGGPGGGGESLSGDECPDFPLSAVEEKPVDEEEKELWL